MTGRLATQRLLYHGESDVAAGGMCVGGCQLSHLLHLSRILSLPLDTLLPQQPAFTSQHSTNYSTFTSQHNTHYSTFTAQHITASTTAAQSQTPPPLLAPAQLLTPTSKKLD